MSVGSSLIEQIATAFFKLPVEANSWSRDLPQPNPDSFNHKNSVPNDPQIAGATIVTPAWYKPTDDLTTSGIIGATRLTVRQVQTAFNTLGAQFQGAPLAVNGVFDQRMQQAVWDWQYLHQYDNPQNPLNVTGEMDLLTQESIQNKYALAMQQTLKNDPGINVPGSPAWQAYQDSLTNIQKYL